MRLLFTADWQATWANLDKCRRVHELMLDVIRKRQIDAWVHLGDVKQVYNPVDQRVTNFWLRVIGDVLSENCAAYVLRGNHDRVSMSDTSEDCLPVMRAAGAATFDEPSTIQTELKARLAFVPYHADPEMLVGHFAKVAPTKSKTQANLLLFHCEVIGAQFDNSMPIAAGVRLEDMCTDCYDLCVGGHIHKPQKCGSNVVFVGSPFAHDWKEVNQAKRFLVYDTKTRKLDSVPTGMPGYFDPARPEFKDAKPATFTGSHIRSVVFADATGDVSVAVDGERRKLEKKYPGAIVQVDVDRTKNVKTAAEISSDMSDSETVKAYLEANPPECGSWEAMHAYLIYTMAETGAMQRSFSGLVFKEAHATNFLPYKEASLKLDAGGVTLVTGTVPDWDEHSNGAGKTSLIEIPVVALTGRTLKGQTGDKWVNRYVKKQLAEVRLTFDLPDGRSCQIIRQRRPPKVSLMIDGTDQSSGIGLRDTDKSIEFITGITRDVLVNGPYMDSSGVNRMLSGTDKERKEIFSQFLHLERFADAQKLIKKDQQKCVAAMARVEQLIALVDQEIHLRTEALENMRKLIDLSTAKKKCAAANERLTDAENKLEKYNASVRKELERQQEIVRSCADVEAGLVADLAHAEGQAASLRKQMERMKVLKGKCPVCLQPVNRSTLKPHFEELGKAARAEEKKAAVLEETSAKNTVERETAQDAVDQIQRTRNVYEERIREMRMEVSHAEADLTEAQRATDNLVSYMAATDRLRADRTVHERYLSELRNLRQFYECAVSVYSRNGIPLFMAARLCPQLNASAERYAQLFTDGEIRVRFKLEADGDIDVDVENKHGGKHVQDQSRGELRLASIIVSFALRETMVPCNVIVLDEPGDGLDPKNARRFATSLNSIAERFGHVLLTTHNAHIIEALCPDRIIEIKKVDGIAEVCSG